MGIKLEINLTNKWMYTSIVIAFLLILGIGVFAYTQSIPNPGHGANAVWISVPGFGEMTLQDAIDQNKLGGENKTFTEQLVDHFQKTECEYFDAGKTGLQQCDKGWYAVGLFADDDDDYSDGNDDDSVGIGGIRCCKIQPSTNSTA